MPDDDGRALLDFIRANRSWFCGGVMTQDYEARAVVKLDEWLARSALSPESNPEGQR